MICDVELQTHKKTDTTIMAIAVDEMRVNNNPIKSPPFCTNKNV